MSKYPWFPMFASDWLGSTKRAVMTLEEQGAYMNLLAHQWGDDQCCLPDDDEVLASLSELRDRWVKGTTNPLRRCFPPHPTREGFIANPKLLEVWANKEEQRRRSSEGGKKSAQLRKQGKGTPSTLDLPLQDPSCEKSTTTSIPTSRKPPPPTPSVTSDPEDNGWNEVEVHLRKLKLSDTAAVVRTAKQRGLPVRYINALLAHYEAHAGAWEPGAIHWRIRKAFPGDEPTELWPDVSNAYRLRQERAATVRNRSQSQANAAKAEQQEAADDAELARLEQSAGKELDAMSDDDAERLARVVLNGMALTLYLKSGRSSPLARPALLEYLANEQKPKT